MRKNGLSGGACVLLLANVTALVLGGGPSFGQGRPVEVSRSVVRDVALRLNLVGTIQPQISTTVSAEAAGRIERVCVNEGDEVLEGGVLAELDRDIVEVRLAQAAARLRQAEDEFQRVRKLVERDLTSQEKMQQAETELALRKADHRLAEIALEHATIRSPISGVISRKYAEMGEWINAGGKIADVIKTDMVYVLTSVPEQHIGHIQAGLKATVSCDAYGERTFSGAVKYIIPQAEGNSHAFPVKIEVGNADNRLKSGMFVRVDLAMARAKKALTVPKDAVVKDGGETYVFQVEGSKARRVPVKTGRADGNSVAVEGDLSPGAPVVVTGNEGLKDGAEVKVVRTLGP